MYIALAGLFTGVTLRVVVPYIRAVLEKIAETGKIKPWPLPFNWRYLALFLLPVLEYGVAFLITEGLWETVLSWSFVVATMTAYAGTALGKEVIQIVAAARESLRQ